MANLNAPNGLHPKNIKSEDCNEYLCYPGLASLDGDTLYFNSQGYLVSTPDASYPIAGAQNGSMYTPAPGNGLTIPASASLGDKVLVWDNPLEVFIAQESSYAEADRVTTSVSATCFDIAGSYGAQYVNASATTYDTVRILKRSQEPDTGKTSAIGAYAKVECQYNPNQHFRTKTS